MWIRIAVAALRISRSSSNLKDSGSSPGEKGMEKMAHVSLFRPHSNIIKADIQKKQLQETPAVPRTSGQIMTAWQRQ